MKKEKYDLRTEDYFFKHKQLKNMKKIGKKMVELIPELYETERIVKIIDKKKTIPCPTEYQAQCAVIKWARVASLQDVRLELLHGDSSGVRVPIGCAVKMKSAGSIKGYPDLFLPVKTPVYSGFFIELKREKGGVVSPEQNSIMARLRLEGFRVEVCRGADEAIRAIRSYLGL